MFLKQMKMNEHGSYTLIAIPMSPNTIVAIDRAPEMTKILKESKIDNLAHDSEVLSVHLKNGTTMLVFDNFTRLSKLANVNILHG